MARGYSTDPSSVRENAASAASPVGAVWPELEALIGPGGALGKRLVGYERRPGQELMMRTIASTLERGEALAVEAGTGIGKSLGYLIPAALSGLRVIVSTATRTLQDQLWERQVPFIRDELGVSLEATVLKGRTNYLCLHLLEKARDNPAMALDEHRELELIGAWSETTASGDRAELHDLPERSRAWRAVAADAEQCLGRSCPRFADCFLMAARRKAEAADLVIVNHHLFFADLQLRHGAGFSLLPECDAAIFDEAHHLEDIAALAFGRSVSDARIRRLAGDLRRAFRAAERDAGLLVSPLAELDRDCERLFGLLSQLPARARLDPARQPERFHDAWYKLDNSLIGLGLLAGARARGDEGLVRMAGRIDELRADLAALLDPQLAEAGREDPDEEEVRWIERGARATFVRSAPIHVGLRLDAALTPRFSAVVFTSATLATRDGFRHFRDRLGLSEDARELLLPSPFDFPKQALMYVARDLPHPRAPDHAMRAFAVIDTLVQLTRGRALLLFTSHQRMQEAHRALAAGWELESLVQGQGSKEALLARFREGAGAVLFATATFWEGVDIIGEALSLVVIDKLPFQPPGDPLVDARLAQLSARGVNGFMDYQVPRAILALKQGVGRLIRHRGDRGIIAILDPRLATARYGSIFVASLPPARTTFDLGELARWWEELEASAGGDA